MASLALGLALMTLVIAGLLGPLEAARPRVGAPITARAALTCGALLVVNTALMDAVGGVVLDEVELAWAELTVRAWPAPARVALAWVLGDVAGYAVHRAMHRVPALWRLHRVHHAPVPLTWVEAWRQHPLDFALHGVAVGLPGALLGASLSDVASVVLLRRLFTAFLHADVDVRLGWLERWIASPAVHHRHHGAARADQDSNFAGTFSAVDRLFGTYRAAD